MLAVPTAGTLALAWFAVVQPDIGARVLIASIVWATTLTACAVALHRSPEPAMARRVLIGILLTLAVFMLLRTVYFLTAARQVADVLDRASWMNMLTPLMAAVLPVIGTTAFLLMCSERIRRQWEHAASTDALTGLANRRTLTRVGGERLLRARESDDGFALAIVDVDHFKSINDRFGHDVGDLALRHVADALAAAGGTQALTGRHGGEEFVVLLPARGDAATTQAQRLREAVRNAPFLAPSNALTITVSIGVTDARAEDRSLDDLLRRADQALYTAKRDGRDRVVVA
jgi:diguanylate cyclase (GGDEF)-like protein